MRRIWKRIAARRAKEFKGHRCAKIKAGVISLTTGNMVKMAEILSLFKE